MRQLSFIEPGIVRWEEVPDPRVETPDDALVRPLVVTTCDLDHAIVHGRVPLGGPFPLGHEFVAEVVETGDTVGRFRRGDRVVVPFQISCGRCDRCTRGLTGSCRTAGPGAAYGMKPIGGDWEMVSSSFEAEKTAAFAARFKVPVDKDGEARLTYRVRVKY